MNKNTESDFKTKPHRPPGQANNLPTRPPTSTPLSSQGFLILPSARATPPQPKGAGAESKNKEGPPKSPRAGRGQSRIHCLCHPTPTTAAPAPPPSPRTARAPGLSLAQPRAVPFPPRPRQPGDPTTEQLGRGKRRRGTTGRCWGRGLFLRAPVDPSSSPSPPPRLLRCLQGFLLSCCQLGSADQSELLTGRTNRKA